MIVCVNQCYFSITENIIVLNYSSYSFCALLLVFTVYLYSLGFSDLAIFSRNLALTTSCFFSIKIFKQLNNVNAYIYYI